jgi:hypothetical protein
MNHALAPVLVLENAPRSALDCGREAAAFDIFQCGSIPLAFTERPLAYPKGGSFAAAVQSASRN